MAGSGPPQGHGPNMNASFVTTPLVGVAISLPIIATAATGLRFYARRLKSDGRSRADDWTLLISLLLCWGHSINTLVAGGIGGINTITMPPRQYANVALRTLWISSFFLVTALYTVKLSILLFYYHLFSVKEWFRKAVIGMIIIISLWWLSSIILVFASTDPIDSSWKDAARAHHRFNFNNWYVSYSGISILFDFVILCFPIPMIKSLHVNTKQKISILGIFWLGGFVCVSAIIRFVFLVKSINRLADLGQNQYNSITVAFIWAEVEPNTSVVAACLPTYGPLFKEGTFFPSIVRSVRTALGMPSKTVSGTHPSEATNTNNSGYYELDRTISSKGNGDLFSEIGTKKSVIRTEGLGDVEPQLSPDLDRKGVPKAWVRR